MDKSNQLGTPASPNLKKGTATSPKMQNRTPISPKVKKSTPNTSLVKKSTPGSPKAIKSIPTSSKVKKITPASSKVKNSTLTSPKVKKSTLRSPKVIKSTSTSPKMKKSTPTSPKAKKNTPASLKIKKTTPASPKIKKSTPTTPKVKKSTLDSPKTNKSTPTSPKMKKSTLSSPKAQKSTPASLKIKKSISTSPKAIKSIPASPKAIKSIPASPKAIKSIPASLKIKKSITTSPKVKKSTSTSAKKKKSTSTSIKIKRSSKFKGKKKRMKKADKKNQQDPVLKEEERQALLAAAKERRSAARKAEKDVATQEDHDQEIRCKILEDTVAKFKESIQKKVELLEALREKEEWIQYLSVGTGPNPRQSPELTCALHRWREQRMESCDFELAHKRAEEVHQILKTLDEIIKYPDDITPQQLKIYKEVNDEINVELMTTVEGGTLTWVRDSCEELEEVRTSHSTPIYKLALWMLMPLPPRMPKPQDEDMEPIELDFPELSVNITLPGKNNWRGVVFRGLWLSDDGLSSLSESYAEPKPYPFMVGMDLLKFLQSEHEEICNTRQKQAESIKTFYASIKTRITVLQVAVNEDKTGNAAKTERMEIDRLSLLDPEPMKLPKDIVTVDEADRAEDYLKTLVYTPMEHEVNLRSHRLCGGILRLQLLEQPARPKRMKGEMTLTLLENDEKLSEVKFCEVYNPPPAPAPGAVRTPDEIEADIRRQEAALERLFLIHIQLPDTVLWLEPPVVCSWDAKKQKWLSYDVHDLKYNEDKFTVNFRTGQLRPIGFATYKYSNLPYQGWELRPNDDHTGVNVTIMGATIVCEFEVTTSGIMVKSIQNGATQALQDMVNQTFELRKLIGRLQAGGVDFFPTEDAPNIIPGSCLKLWPLEKHMYHCMAHLCTAYNFQWSRWNVSAGRRAVVQQFREFTSPQHHTEAFDILHATPLQTLIVVATEVSSEYSTQPIENFGFYPDLYSMAEGHGTTEIKKFLHNIPWQLVENVNDLLCAVKLFSYS